MSTPTRVHACMLTTHTLLCFAAMHACCSSIIVLADMKTPDTSDAHTLRIVLSLLGIHQQTQASGRGVGLKVGEGASVDIRDRVTDANTGRSCFAVHSPNSWKGTWLKLRSCSTWHVNTG